MLSPTLKFKSVLFFPVLSYFLFFSFLCLSPHLFSSNLKFMVETAPRYFPTLIGKLNLVPLSLYLRPILSSSFRCLSFPLFPVIQSSRSTSFQILPLIQKLNLVPLSFYGPSLMKTSKTQGPSCEDISLKTR